MCIPLSTGCHVGANPTSPLTLLLLLLLLKLQLTAYGKLEAGEEAMQQEILARGPIVCGIACPDVFTYHYHSSKNGGKHDGHCREAVDRVSVQPAGNIRCMC